MKINVYFIFKYGIFLGSVKVGILGKSWNIGSVKVGIDSVKVGIGSVKVGIDSVKVGIR